MKNRRKLPSRLCALLLAMALLCSIGIPQAAAAGGSVSWSQVDNDAVTAQLPLQEAEEAAPAYRDTDLVRVSIFLEDAPAISKFGVQNIAENQAAVQYRASLETRQEAMAQAISAQALGGKQLDVVWNLTLAANLISANVEYGEIDAIRQVPGVEQVILETQYAPAVVDVDLPDDPNMSTSSSMIGSNAAWAAGYTGAGSRIAVIDTGTDTDHQSFSAAGFDYSLQKQAEQAGKTVEDYNLLDTAEIASVLSQLHVSSGVTANQLYLNTKLPFGYNYVDKDLDITHDRDQQGEHGSHVAGISTANAYIPNADGTFSNALDTVKVQGVAPDAQLITMKVFGKNGGAYESDYLVAIEDAIVLKCDSINLSLGSSNPGASRHDQKEYQAILDSLAQCGVVVAIAAGNASSWVAEAQNAGYLYADDVSMDMVGSPGSYTNSLCVASIDNAGVTGEYFTVGENVVVYTQSTGFKNQPLATIAGEHEYLLIDGVGTEEEFSAIASELEGKIAVCSRGTTSFYQKAEAAVANGAIATIIYNNQPGSISMDLTDYTQTAPCVSVTQADGAMLKAAATPVTGAVQYYVGKLTVKEGIGSQIREEKYHTMSDFSSWGVPGTLEMKPEITAPGGNIYSVNGLIAGGTSYENMSGTSMATPQVAGMVALVAQYIRESGLAQKTGLTPRVLAQSLLMSTAVPQLEDWGEEGDGYYPVLRQGAGLANVSKAIAADSYILMGADANQSYADGKVKVELGDDPARTGDYTFSFSIHNLTDVEKTYALSADFFTQGVFTNVVNQNGDQGDYMDTWTAMLDADVTFDVGQSVTVSANGSADVKVTVKLTDAQKAALNDKYPSGAYIQGFVYAKSGATTEGAEGTEHSIPVLGFYGNWSDGSMFEVGSRLEYDTNSEVRLPYLGSTNTNLATITYANDPGSRYLFGGNPVVTDTRYLPERTAINSENGDQISQLTVSVIRNAAASRVQVENLTAGKSMMDTEAGAMDAAYYHTNSGTWRNTSANVSVDFAPRGASQGDQLALTLTLAPEYYVDREGNVNWEALGKGASFTVPMVVDNTAPELLEVSLSLMGGNLTVQAKDNQYVAGVVLYNASGAKILAKTGAKQDIQPGEAAQYTLDLTGVTGKSFLLRVYDYALNAATYQVNLQNGGEDATPDVLAFQTGTRTWVGLDQADSKDLGELATSEQVYVAAAEVDGMIFAATEQGGLYVLDEADLSIETYVANMGVVLTDMAYYPATSTLYGVTGNRLVQVDKLTGAVTDLAEIPFPTSTLACDGDGTFYSAVYGDSNEVANRGFVYAYTLETLQGTSNLDYDFDGSGRVDGGDVQALLDYATGARETIEKAENGDFDGDGALTSRDAYLFDGQLSSGQLGEAPRQISSKTRNNVRALAWNFNDGQLYGLTCAILSHSTRAYFYEINPETGAETMHRDFRTETTSLVLPQKASGGSWSSPTDTVSGIQISAQTLTMLQGSSKTLTAAVQPWTATDRTVTWTSADPAIATVDDEGVVTAVAPGETVITAASTLNSSFTASCTVTVEALDVTLKGALQDKEGNPMLFTWNMEEDNTWTPGAALSTSLAAIAYDGVMDRLYLQDSTENAWFMHQVDLTTGQEDGRSATACSFGFAMSDLAALEQFNTREKPGMMGVAQAYLIGPCAPLDNTFNTGWDLADYLTEYTGGTKFVALASGGTETNEKGVVCDLMIALDDAGWLWTFQYDGTSSIGINLIPTDLNLSFPSYQSYQYGSMVVGDDGNLYLSHFTGETNEFYRLAWNEEQEMFISDRIGQVGAEVWPAALYAVESNAATTEAVEATGILEEPLRLEAQMMNASAPMSQVTPGEDSKTVTMTITAKDGQGVDAASNNGIISVSYNKAALELQEIAVSGDYTAQVTGSGAVTFGYVSREGIAAGDPVATLTFGLKTGADATVTVQHRELNDGKPGFTEELPVDLECPSEAFQDLDTGRWYHEYTDYVIAKGLMNGMDETHFAPEGSLTRGMLVTALYRLAGEPEVTEPATFTDVAQGRYYADAVAWAEDLGIVKGITATAFQPEGTVTRQQAATFLYRYVTEYLEQEAVEGADLTAFTDGSKVQDYAKTAMSWAVAEGFFEGYGDGTLRPFTALTRAQMAKLLTILDLDF